MDLHKLRKSLIEAWPSKNSKRSFPIPKIPPMYITGAERNSQAGRDPFEDNHGLTLIYKSVNDPVATKSNSSYSRYLRLNNSRLSGQIKKIR